LKLLPALALCAFFAAPVVQAAPRTLEITRAWSRPAVAGTNGVGYLTVANHGPRADEVVSFATPLAGRVDMHSMSMAGGVMSMAKVARVAVPAGGQAEFAPGGYHLMLIGLTRTLTVGDQVPMTVTFASGAKLQARLVVGLNPPSS
jgi:hypothetical protein